MTSYIKEANFLKKIFLTITLILVIPLLLGLVFTACSDRDNVEINGGRFVINLPDNEKFESLFFEAGKGWVTTRRAKFDDLSEVHFVRRIKNEQKAKIDTPDNTTYEIYENINITKKEK